MRQAERIKEKVSLHLEGRQIALLVAFALVVSGGVFFAGFQLGRQSAPKAAAITSVLGTPEVDAAQAAKAAKSTAPVPPAPPKYTYDRTLTLPTPPVQIDDATLRIAHEKREELASEGHDKAKRALDDFVASGRAGTAFEGKRLPGGPGPDAPTGRIAQPPVVKPPPDEEQPIRGERQGGNDGQVDEPTQDAPAGAPAPPPARGDEPEAPKAGAKAFTIQIKAFRAKDEAREFMAMLLQSGHKAFLTTADVPNKGRFYRVRLGKFSTMEAADRKRKAFERAEGFQTIVTPF
jgi:DedD protein